MTVTFVNIGITNFSIFCIREFRSHHTEQARFFFCEIRNFRGPSRGQEEKGWLFWVRVGKNSAQKAFGCRCITADTLLCASSQLVSEQGDERCQHQGRGTECALS